MRYPNFSFLLEGERGWIHSRSFFNAMRSLGINVAEFEVAANTVISPEETIYYADCVFNVLRLMKRKQETHTEEYEYVTYIAKILKSWGEKNYVVHVVETDE